MKPIPAMSGRQMGQDPSEADLPDDPNIRQPDIRQPDDGTQETVKRSRVFEYGLLAPDVNGDVVRDQMWHGHRYRNALVEIERTRRSRISLAMSLHPDAIEIESDISALEKSLEESRRSILSTRQQSRRRTDSAEQREEARGKKIRLKELRGQLREARRKIAQDPKIEDEIRQANASSAEGVRAARASCGVYWGTYLLHEAAMASSRRSPAPPDFVRWIGEGRVSVQLQGGVDVSDLWGSDTQIQIVASPDQPGRRRRDDHGYHRLRLRVQSTRGKPVWAEFPMVMHRPIPAGGRIKVATVSLRRRGTSWDWKVHLTVDESACAPRGGTRAGRTGRVALNLGFARRPDGGLRAGYLVGSDGWETEVMAQGSNAYRDNASDRDRRRTIGSLDKADAIRSRRDLDLDAMRTSLCEWLRSRPEGALPDWLVEQASHLASWRSPGRFATLTRSWQRNWFEAGDGGYDLLERWRVRDLHLERYETGMRTAAQRNRREGYRILAARVARRYESLIIDDTNLMKFQQSPPPEIDREEIDAVKHQQRVAAPSELRAAMMNAFGPQRTIKRSRVDVTRRHAWRIPAEGEAQSVACGAVCEIDPSSREQTCEQCGATFDQDANACRNLLRDGEDGPGVTLERKPGRAERMSAAKAANKAAKAATRQDSHSDEVSS